MASKEKKFICSEEGCAAVFSRGNRLKIHMRTHTGERPYVCTYEDCTKSYVRSSHLNRHEASHEQDSIRCSFGGCKTVLKNSATLAKHISIYHTDKKIKTYKCKHCDAEFQRRCLLKEHSYQHSGIKPYVCPEAGCEKHFIYPSRLKIHMKVHKGYKCTYENCHIVCSTWSLYRKHVKVYHPRTYKCEVCSKSFAQSYNFHMHKKTHVDVLERESFCCPFPNCPRFYTEKHNLAYHIKQYHDKRHFACTYEGCGSSFKEEDHLKKHLRVHDPSIPISKKKKKKPSFAARLAGFTGLAAVDLEQVVTKKPSNDESIDSVDEKVVDVAESEPICDVDKPSNDESIVSIDEKIVNAAESEPICDVDKPSDDESIVSVEENIVDEVVESEPICDVDTTTDLDSSNYQVITFTYQSACEDDNYAIYPIKNLDILDLNSKILLEEMILPD